LPSLKAGLALCSPETGASFVPSKKKAYMTTQNAGFKSILRWIKTGVIILEKFNAKYEMQLHI